MAQPQIALSALAKLRSNFAGTVLQPADADYDNVRALHNGLIDKRPAVIARCLNEADIAAAIAFAREHGLEIAVRGGGHNVSGRASVEGGVMIDLSLMKTVTVNAATRRAVAQGGVTWGEFNRATQEHGLATTGGVISTTGIAGLTLGGGYGYLAGKHGLATDNLVAATVVTAEGKTVSRQRLPRIPISTGRCAAAAATSEWSHPSSTNCIPSDPRSWQAPSRGRLPRRARCCACIASSPRQRPTNSPCWGEWVMRRMVRAQR